MGDLANLKIYMVEYRVRRTKAILKNNDQDSLFQITRLSTKFQQFKLYVINRQGYTDQNSLETGPLVYENMTGLMSLVKGWTFF